MRDVQRPRKLVRHVQPGSFDREVTSFSGSQPTVITAFTEFYKILWGGAVSNIVHQSAQFELDSAHHWKPAVRQMDYLPLYSRIAPHRNTRLTLTQSYELTKSYSSIKKYNKRIKSKSQSCQTSNRQIPDAVPDLELLIDFAHSNHHHHHHHFIRSNDTSVWLFDMTTEQDNKAQTCTDSWPIVTVIVNHAS